MNLRLTVASLLGAVLIFVAPARGTSIRTGSSYGQIAATSSTAAAGIGTEYLVPLTPISPDDFDLLLQISPTSSFLNNPIQITIGLTSPPFFTSSTSTDSFGILNCNNDGSGTAGSNLGMVCTPTGNSTCDLSGATVNGNTITLPGACVTANETFFFDESTPGGAFASVTTVAATTTPEPSSLALIGISLVTLALLSRRRLLA
jgi:hypothetical protein